MYENMCMIVLFGEHLVFLRLELQTARPKEQKGSKKSEGATWEKSSCALKMLAKMIKRCLIEWCTDPRFMYFWHLER